eukprot:gene20216-26246_t
MSSELVRHQIATSAVAHELRAPVSVEGKTPPPISFDPNISYVFVSVKDQGKGILPEELPILFSSYGKLPNKTVEGSHVSELCGSTGLGLFNCKNFLGRLGGCVWVSWSQVDAGSEFTFAMPYNDCIDDLESISLSSDMPIMNGYECSSNIRETLGI